MIIYTDRFSRILSKSNAIKLFRILNLSSEKLFSFFTFGSILRLNNFLLKHKISEQQISSKVLSIASACHYNGNSKNGKKNSFIDKCPPLRSYSNKSPPTGQKLGCKSLRKLEGSKFWVQIPGSARWGWLWMKSIPALVKSFELKAKPLLPIDQFSF